MHVGTPGPPTGALQAGNKHRTGTLQRIDRHRGGAVSEGQAGSLCTGVRLGQSKRVQGNRPVDMGAKNGFSVVAFRLADLPDEHHMITRLVLPAAGCTCFTLASACAAT